MMAGSMWVEMGESQAGKQMETGNPRPDPDSFARTGTLGGSLSLAWRPSR
jgi:hypothetical protein